MSDDILNNTFDGPAFLTYAIVFFASLDTCGLSSGFDAVLTFHTIIDHVFAAGHADKAHSELEDHYQTTGLNPKQNFR